MQQQIRMPCPECRQLHDNPKQAEQCIIAALNRWLIVKHHITGWTSQQELAQAELRNGNMIVYYLGLLMHELHRSKVEHETQILGDFDLSHE